VTVRDAYANTDDEDNFFIRTDENLPEEGNNIYIRMICDTGTTSAAVVLGAWPSGENFVYALESGASGSLRFEGLVNERGDMAWSETKVSVSVCFAISVADSEPARVPAPAAPEEEPLRTEGRTPEEAPPEANTAPADIDPAQTETAAGTEEQADIPAQTEEQTETQAQKGNPASPAEPAEATASPEDPPPDPSH
jgi:hypothetical protein